MALYTLVDYFTNLQYQAANFIAFHLFHHGDSVVGLSLSYKPNLKGLGHAALGNLFYFVTYEL